MNNQDMATELLIKNVEHDRAERELFLQKLDERNESQKCISGTLKDVLSYVLYEMKDCADKEALIEIISHGLSRNPYVCTKA